MPQSKPQIYTLYESPLSAEEIESRSFAAIDAEAPAHRFTPEEWVVVRRMIHTTANFALAESVRFSPSAIDAAARALENGARIYTDANMIRSGISLTRLQAVRSSYTAADVVCHVADADVAESARRAGLPRSLFAVRKAKDLLHGGIAVFGNAPVALMELNRMIIEEGVRPAVVLAMPVGFVHVVESKTELMSLDVPFVAIGGRFGGSPLAVSTIHSLCAVALARKNGGQSA